VEASESFPCPPSGDEGHPGSPALCSWWQVEGKPPGVPPAPNVGGTVETGPQGKRAIQNIFRNVGHKIQL